MTKAHEELVRGPIKFVLETLKAPIGEFTVVIDIGHITELDLSGRPQPQDLASEFSEMTASGQLTRRRAVAALARKHGLAPNLVYEALEKIKKSVV